MSIYKRKEEDFEDINNDIEKELEKTLNNINETAKKRKDVLKRQDEKK